MSDANQLLDKLQRIRDRGNKEPSAVVDLLVDEINTQAARIKALEKDAAWQPIETVPKDHFPRLFRVNGYVVQGFVDVTGAYLVQQNGKMPCKFIGKPAHWMPLPSPTMQEGSNG